MNINKNKIIELEQLINSVDFWNDKEIAQKILKEYSLLKNNTIQKENSIIFSIIAGSGGDDSEDFVSMLLSMYKKYLLKNNFKFIDIDSTPNTLNGYKNVTIEINGLNAYDELKNESGVHRLVRISPFNSKGQRHTSFALVDVIPKLPDLQKINLNLADLEINFTNASGPGGQNVNKRETAVRVVHIPTKISVRVQSERSQLQNKEKAIEILKSKLYSLMQKERVKELKELTKVGDMAISWGNQVRSYVLHPYKMIKDLRSGYEESNTKAVFEGELDGFIESLKK